ncbi:MAG: hypothetical protein N4A50_15015 [Vallitalea sp.]|nr:hypothetical protein [Vallitalea sp.]
MKKEKVKIMTRLAIYEKNVGKDDFSVNSYFKSNYVSYNNFKTRLGVAFAMLIIFGADIVRQLSQNINNALEFDYIKMGARYIIILVVVLTIYTIISTMIYKKRYKKAQVRISQYKKLLNKLDKIIS